MGEEIDGNTILANALKEQLKLESMLEIEFLMGY